MVVELHPSNTAKCVFDDVLEAGPDMSRSAVEAAAEGQATLEDIEHLLAVYGPQFFVDVCGAVIGETLEEYLARTALN